MIAVQSDNTFFGECQRTVAEEVERMFDEIADACSRGCRRETKTYRDAQYKTDAERVKALRRAQFRKGGR